MPVLSPTLVGVGPKVDVYVPGVLELSPRSWGVGPYDCM